MLAEHGITDYILRVTGKIAPLHYSVQWNETDLDYMLRRMQQDGLFYFFAFAQGKHTLIVSDHVWGYDKAATPEVRLAEGSAAQDHVTTWRRRFAFTPGRRAGADWNFETMQAPGATQPTFAVVPGNADHELYEFPGRFLDSTAAEQMMKNRIQATESGFETVAAASTVRTLGAGQTFTPLDVAKPQNVFAKQVVTAIRHSAQDPTYETGRGLPSYDNTFNVMPATTAATPHRIQRRPRIDGSQIALIAGPSGEEIFTDQYGRVKVWFPWDRRARKDGSDTCWIRVGQPWAGGTWGHQVIPRVGMEALVSYQEGDPDRPFVTALVPDPVNKVPYLLPTYKTRMVFRSNSYKAVGFNEISFDDNGGKEEIFMQAQKDMHVGVKNNFVQYTNAFHHQQIGASETRVVWGWADYYVNENLTIMTGRNKFVLVGQPDQLTTMASSDFVDRAPFELPFGSIAMQTDLSQEHQQGSLITLTAGDVSTTVGTDWTLHVNGNAHDTYDGGYASISGQDHAAAATTNMTMSAGTNMIIAAGDALVISCGASSITMTADGDIKITGATLEITGSSEISAKAPKIKLNDPD